MQNWKKAIVIGSIGVGAVLVIRLWSDNWQTGRNDSVSVAIIRSALSISSQKSLGQAPQGDGADQSN